MSNKTPLAIFTYNRPEHTARLLDSVSRCTRLDECQVVIYCDAAKNEAHLPGVEASQAVVHGWAKQNGAEIIQRSENLGLARSIVGGVTDLCSQYGQVIVLEDDLVVSPDFLDYMLQALERYRDSAEVFQVSGYMFPVPYVSQVDTLLLPLTTTWGWATWDRAWRNFDWHASGASAMLQDPILRSQFNLQDSYPYAEMLEQRLAGKNQSWGILWWWCIFQFRGQVVYPRQSLVWQGGLDGTGVHSGVNNRFIQPKLESFFQPRLAQPIRWSDKIAACEPALLMVQVHLRAQRRAALARPKQLLKRIFKRVIHLLS